MEQKKQAKFSSGWGFILSAVGSAVGMANVWGFPAKMGAICWFWVMKKSDLPEEVNKGTGKPHGTLWHSAGKYLHVACALFLSCAALFMQVAF